MKKFIFLIGILALLIITQPLQNPDSPPVILEEPVLLPQPIWAEVNWYDPVQVIKYLYDTNLKLAGFMKDLIRRESSFNPDAVNGNFVGLVQIGPEACRAVGISYHDAKTLPHMNIEAGSRFVEWYCIPQAIAAGKHNADEVYKRYNLGPWYDKASSDST
jgi:hypothetical protein